MITYTKCKTAIEIGTLFDDFDGPRSKEKPCLVFVMFQEQLARDARKEQLSIIRKWRIYVITNAITQGFFPLSREKTVPCFLDVLDCIVCSVMQSTGLFLQIKSIKEKNLEADAFVPFCLFFLEKRKE